MCVYMLLNPSKLITLVILLCQTITSYNHTQSDYGQKLTVHFNLLIVFYYHYVEYNWISVFCLYCVDRPPIFMLFSLQWIGPGLVSLTSKLFLGCYWFSEYSGRVFFFLYRLQTCLQASAVIFWVFLGGSVSSSSSFFYWIQHLRD